MSICKIAKNLEQFLYRKSTRIVVVTRGFIKHISRHTDKNKIIFCPNGITVAQLNDEASPVTRLSLNIPDKPIIGYYGILGESQNIIEFAQIISKQDHFHFLIVGFGQHYDAIRKLNFKNVTLLSLDKPMENGAKIG